MNDQPMLNWYDEDFWDTFLVLANLGENYPWTDHIMKKKIQSLPSIPILDSIQQKGETM